MADLQVDIGGLKLKNPVIVASGTFGYGREFNELYDLSLLGGIAVKGTTFYPRAGNPPPRIMETASGMLNSVGLQNPGVYAVIEEEIPFLRQFDTAIIVNIAGHNEEQYRAVAEKLVNAEGVDAIEVNISCPNVASGGMAFGTDPVVAARVTSIVRETCPKIPLIVKLSPNVTDICEIAKAVADVGADAISLVNTFLGMAVDIEKRCPVLANTFGGLSGPAIKPLALRMVWQVAQAVDIPVIGMGGILSAQDALEFIMAGASAIQIGSGNFYNPLAAPEVIEGINNWLDEKGINNIQEIIGAAW